MKIFHITLHGLVLLLANIVAIFAGFLIYRALGTNDQLATQLPVAALLSVLMYLTWVLLLRTLASNRLDLRGVHDHVLAGVCSLFWNPVVFIPLHYVTQGYLSDAGNIIALGTFQIPVNVIALLLVWRVTQGIGHRVLAE